MIHAMDLAEGREKFASDLMAGEHLLWTGRPDPGVLFTSGDWFLVPFSLLWGGIAISIAGPMLGLWGHEMTAAHPVPLPFRIIPLVFPLIGLYFIAGRFAIKMLRKKKTWYAITNRRALILTEGWSRSVNAAMLESIPSVNLSVRKDGIGTVRFGNASPFVAMYENTGLEVFGGFHGTAVPTFFDVREAAEAHRIAMTQLGGRSG